MKRIFLTLVPWMALASTGGAQTRLAEVSYTHRDATPVHAYRLGDECFVPLDALPSFGWHATPKDTYAAIVAEGKSFTLPTRVFAGKATIPLRKAIALMGGGAEWISRTDTIQVFAPVASVSVHNGRLQASSTLGLKPSVFLLSNPSRVVVDFEGARLSVGATKDVEPGVRVSQFKENTVRIVMESANLSEAPKINSEETRDVDLDLKQIQAPTQANTSAGAEAKVEHLGRTDEDPPKLAETKPTLAESAKVDLPKTLQINVDRESEALTSLSIPITGISKFDMKYAKPDPDRLEITLPHVNGVLPDAIQLETDAVKSVMARQDGWNTILMFQLSRPMGVEVVMNKAGLEIRLLKPRVGDGKLAGKTIIVDAGHGGEDPGSGFGGIHEKDLTLPVSKLVAEELAKEGAVVILTRRDDSYPTLLDRSGLANRNNADYFVSIHINKTAGNGATNTSGSITFYHGGQKSSEVLAECIQKELAKVSRIPSLGVWSDKRIYDSGFSVLRNTVRMPGVLVELGFINNATDRKRMVTADFQKSAAAAIVKGVKVYLGNATEEK